MRDAINNNPMVQIGLLAGLLLVVGVLMMSRMGGGGAESTDSNAASAVAVGSSSAGSAESVTSGVPPAGLSTATGGAAAAPATSATPSAPAAPVSPEALKAGPGLPAPVADAIKAGDSVVLLIVEESAVDDRLVEDSVSNLSGRSGVEVFVVPAGEIADYSRVTQSVGVNRVPALVVVRPQKGGQAPEAFVSYGFRNPASITQAVEDALYKGKENLPYHPG